MYTRSYNASCAFLGLVSYLSKLNGVLLNSNFNYINK